jgi:hypothetical protein
MEFREAYRKVPVPARAIRGCRVNGLTRLFFLPATHKAISAIDHEKKSSLQ